MTIEYHPSALHLANKKKRAYPLIIDRLTLTCDFPKSLYKTIIFNFLQVKAKQKKDNYLLSVLVDGEKAFPYYVDKPKLSKNYPTFCFNQYAYIECSPKDTDKNFIRLDFNPSKFKHFGELAVFIEDLLCPPDYGIDYFLDHAKVTRIDFAIDIPNEVVDNFLFYFPKMQYTKIFCKSGKTLYLGGTYKTNLNFRFYDKLPATKQKNNKSKCKEPVPFCDILRIEATIKPKHKLNNKMVSMTFKEYRHKKVNPFAKLEITSTSLLEVQCPQKGSKDKIVIYKLFFAVARYEGVQSALARLPDNTSKVYRKYIKEATPSWWMPVEIWEESNQLIDNLFDYLNK